MLLDKISEREARIDFGIDGPTIRLVIEKLASKARKDFDGLGPLHADEILEIFTEVCGFPPDDRSIVVLQRLPGLSVPRSNDGARHFIDQALADAAKAGDIVRYIDSPFSTDVLSASEWQSTLRELGVKVSAHKCSNIGFTSNKLSTALELSAKKHECYALSGDILQIMQEMNVPISSEKIYIKGVFYPEINCGETDKDFSNVEYQDCVFQTIALASEANEKLLPKFTSCGFGLVDGRVSEKDLPKNVFQNCSFESFTDTSETTSAILELRLALGVRVLLTVLKKLYLQPGSGRRDSALHRGLDQQAQSLLPGVMQILKRENMVLETKSGGRVLWLPIRAQSARVRKMISAPNSSDDSLIRLASNL